MKCNKINFFPNRTTIPSTPPQQTKQKKYLNTTGNELSSYYCCKTSIKPCNKSLRRIVENLISN